MQAFLVRGGLVSPSTNLPRTLAAVDVHSQLTQPILSPTLPPEQQHSASGSVADSLDLLLREDDTLAAAAVKAAEAEAAAEQRAQAESEGKALQQQAESSHLGMFNTMGPAELPASPPLPTGLPRLKRVRSVTT